MVCYRYTSYFIVYIPVWYSKASASMQLLRYNFDLVDTYCYFIIDEIKQHNTKQNTLNSDLQRILVHGKNCGGSHKATWVCGVAYFTKMSVKILKT